MDKAGGGSGLFGLKSSETAAIISGRNRDDNILESTTFRNVCAG
jgi:hypothetical protein